MRLQLGNVEIGTSVFILAEIGNNHNGDFETAKRLIEQAADTGADGVKFQTFTPELLVDKHTPPPPHARGVHKTQRERLASIQLSKEHIYKLKELADARNVIFSSTPFDADSVDLLDELVPFFKVASGDLTNLSLLKHISRTNKPVVLSTGMANEVEIQRAIDVLDKDSLILLHCVSLYPTPLDEVNILSVPYLKEKFGLPVGYSDHSIGITACKVAVSLGAVFIEKHFTLDKSQPLGDHKLSCDPTDLALLVKEIRDIESARGVFGKPVDNQIGVAKIMRRGLYAKNNINQGDILTLDKLVALRPPVGILAEEIDQVLGRSAIVNIEKDTCLEYDMLVE